MSVDNRIGFFTPDDASQYRVYLDGDMKRAVVAFDSDAGWVENCTFDDVGHLVHWKGEPTLTRSYGKVVVRKVPQGRPGDPRHPSAT